MEWKKNQKKKDLAAWMFTKCRHTIARNQTELQ